MKRIIYTLAASVVTLLALANIASACTIALYQPDVPESLKK